MDDEFYDLVLRVIPTTSDQQARTLYIVMRRELIRRALRAGPQDEPESLVEDGPDRVLPSGISASGPKPIADDEEPMLPGAYRT